MTVGIAHVFSKNESNHQNERQDGESGEGQPPIDVKKHADHDGQKKEVVDHGHDAGREQIVQSIDVGCNARNQPADRVAVEIAHGQFLQVTEDFAAHVVHGLLPHALHDANLHILRQKIEDQHQQVDYADQHEAPLCRADSDELMPRGNKVTVQGDLKKFWRRQLQRRDRQRQGQSKNHAPLVRPHVRHQPPHQVRVVRFA